MIIFRFIAIPILFLSYFLTGLPPYLLSIFRPNWGRKIMAIQTRLYCRIVLRLLNIKLEIVGTPLPTVPALLVANHLGYLDIILLASLRPINFITSIEMKKTFFLGELTRLGGCLYVERRSRDNLSVEISDITQGLIHGLSVGLFPEGTSSNGQTVLPFKRSLFASAIQAQVPICPIAISYLCQDHQRDLFCWYGDMPFFSHFIGVLKSKGFRARVQFLEVLTPPFTEMMLDSYKSHSYELISVALK